MENVPTIELDEYLKAKEGNSENLQALCKQVISK